MPFDNLEFIAKAEKDSCASISYRRSSSKRGGGRPRLVIGLPRAVCDGAVIKPGQLFTLQLGTGDDAGKGRIVPTTSGGVQCKLLKGGAVFRFGFVPMLGTDAAEKEFVAVRQLPKSTGGFEVDLPAWFKADD